MQGRITPSVLQGLITSCPLLLNIQLEPVSIAPAAYSFHSTLLCSQIFLKGITPQAARFVTLAGLINLKQPAGVLHLYLPDKYFN